MDYKSLLIFFESLKNESIKEKEDENINLTIEQLERKKDYKVQSVNLSKKEYDNFLCFEKNFYLFDKFSLDNFYIGKSKKSYTSNRLQYFFNESDILYKICKCDLNNKIYYYCVKILNDSFFFSRKLRDFSRNMKKIHISEDYKYSISIDEYNEDICISIIFKENPNEVFIYHDSLMQKTMSIYNITKKINERKIYIIKNKEKVFNYLRNKKYLSDIIFKQCQSVYDYLIEDYNNHYKKDKEIISYVE